MTRLALTVAALLIGASPALAAKRCAPLHDGLHAAISIAGQYGRVSVTSVCTGKHARGSWHYRTRDGHALAIDFRVRGDWRGAARALRAWRGGFAHYGGGLFHADVGPARRWR